MAEFRWPDSFAGQPLRGRRLLEVFSGVPAEGGAALSRAWEAAGGVAVRYDNRIDPAHDFLGDQKFWESVLASPPDVIQFGLPCTTFSVARTPKARTTQNPYGTGDDEQVVQANAMALLMVRRCKAFVEKGSLIMIENPLLSFVWLMEELCGLAGDLNFLFVRTDHCMYGTPYQKPQLWLTNCALLAAAGAVCCHPRPHPERLEGSRSRRSQPYPLPLAGKLVECLAAELRDRPAAARAAAVERRVRLKTPAGSAPSPEAVLLGRQMLARVRHGSPAASARELAAAAAEPAPPVPPATEAADGGPVGPLQLEREELYRLQRADPEFGDVVRFLDVLRSAPAGASAAVLHKSVKAMLMESGVDSKGAARRADAAQAQAGDFSLSGGRGAPACRRVWDALTSSFMDKPFVPQGGLRSFYLNGRKYRLPLRKQLLLYFHDGESMGGHTDVRGTLGKLAEFCWWPGMEKDVARWVGSCSVCRLTKPSRALTARQRTELHDRPFRVLFIDAVGPISPPDGEFRYLFHAECLFTWWCWVRPSPADSEEAWAKFLVEEVFFDVCGFLAVLRSDRGSAFTGSVIRAVNELLGIAQVFGSAYHPQSQGSMCLPHMPPGGQTPGPGGPG